MAIAPAHGTSSVHKNNSQNFADEAFHIAVNL
jgi:hypothetical protein